VGCIALDEKVPHVAEEFVVTALIRGDGDSVGILFDCGFDDVEPGPVVTEVDHLGARCLEDTPEDVYRCVMAVEKRCGGYKPDIVRGLGLIQRGAFHRLFHFTR
jgi:hypothetical protein